MTPNDAYQKLKQWQKALSLTDGDTELKHADPRLTKLGQPQPRLEDLKLYEQMLREAMERQIPPRESDRKELEYLKQVLQLPDDSIQLIEQQLTHELMQQRAQSSGFFQSADELAATTLSPPMPNGASPRSPWEQPAPIGSPAMGSPAIGSSPMDTMQQPSTMPAMGSSVDEFATPPPNSSPNQIATMPPSEQSPSIAPTAEPGAVVGGAVKGKIGAALKQKRELAVGGAGASDMEGVPANVVVLPQQAAVVQDGALDGTVPASAGAPQPAEGVQQAPSTSSVDVVVQPAKQRFSRPLVTLGLLMISLITAFSVALWMLNLTPRNQKKDPKMVQNYVSQGNTKTQKQQYSDAINSFNQALQLDSQNPIALVNRGFAQYRSGNPSAAIDDYSKAISIKANFPEAFNNRSHAYNDQGNYDAAMKDANQAIQLRPNFPEAYINLGNAWAGQKNLDQAITSYKTAISQNPPALILSRAYNNRGNANLARGKTAEAINDYNQALQSDSQYADASFNRAIALVATGDRAAAIQGFTNAAKLYDAQKNPDMARKARSQAEQLRLATTPTPGSTTPAPQRSI